MCLGLSQTLFPYALEQRSAFAERRPKQSAPHLSAGQSLHFSPSTTEAFESVVSVRVPPQACFMNVSQVILQLFAIT